MCFCKCACIESICMLLCTQTTVFMWEWKPQRFCVCVVFLASCTANYVGVTELQVGKLRRQGSVSLSQFDTRMKVYYSICTLTWEKVHVEFCWVSIRKTVTSKRKFTDIFIQSKRLTLYITVIVINIIIMNIMNEQPINILCHNEPQESDVTMRNIIKTYMHKLK